MRYAIFLTACLFAGFCFGQSPEERKRLLDPRNYANGMTFVDDAELQIRGSDISKYTVLDTAWLVALYRYRHPYSSKRRKEDGERMKLEIGKRITAFYSRDLYETDSLYTIYNRGISANNCACMVYARREQGYFEVINRMPFRSDAAILVEDSDMPEWRIGTEEMIILGYRCLRATAFYCGREWVVWFTYEIPVAAGPWKLCNLPGLILRAEDGTGDYIFECEALQHDKSLIRKYEWHYTRMKKNAWLAFEKRMYTAPFSLLGVNTLIISGKKGGRLDDTWTIPYNPIELE